MIDWEKISFKWGISQLFKNIFSKSELARPKLAHLLTTALDLFTKCWSGIFLKEQQLRNYYITHFWKQLALRLFYFHLFNKLRIHLKAMTTDPKAQYYISNLTIFQIYVCQLQFDVSQFTSLWFYWTKFCIAVHGLTLFWWF